MIHRKLFRDFRLVFIRCSICSSRCTVGKMVQGLEIAFVASEADSA